MSISLRRRFVRSFAAFLPTTFSVVGLLLAASVAGAQVPPQETKLDKQLHRLDLGVGGAGYFNSSTTGTTYLKTTLTDVPGNTLGALVQIRYTAKPWVGLEFNYGYARFTQKYSTIGGVQANSKEYSAGYVAHLPYLIFGAKPWVDAGLGTMTYKPTPYGGQGLQEQARAVYYYGAGFDDMVTTHIGLRAQFRQSISLAPDFGQNYLTILKRTYITEPAFGFYLKF